MTEPEGQPRIEELEAARQVVALVLKDANANLIFGEKVDPSVLPDYAEVVKNPKDLGSILSDVESSLNGDGPYQTAAEVLKDIELVWSNCLLYNNRPEDKSIVGICKRTCKLFLREWKKAGLAGGISATALKATIASATPGKPADGAPSTSEAKEKEIEILPIHLLTNFEVTASAAPDGELCSIDSLAQARSTGGTLFISGDITASSDAAQGAAPASSKVSGETIVDWVAEYGPSGAPPCIWVVTETAWYKLLQPTERYRAIHTASVQGVALANAAMEELKPEDAGEIGSLIDRIAWNVPSPDASRRRLSLPIEAKEFATAQLEAKLGRRRPRSSAMKKRRAGGGTPGSTVAKRPRSMAKSGSKSRLGGAGAGGGGIDGENGFFLGDEIDAISDDDMPEDYAMSDEEENQEPDALSKARRRGWKRIKYWQRRTDALEKQRILEEAETKREAAEDAARGPPPAPTREFRLPERCVPDLLMVWEFTQAFGDVLQLAPFSLAALEAALAPGPRARGQGPRTSSVKEEEEAGEEDSEDDEGSEGEDEEEGEEGDEGEEHQGGGSGGGAGSKEESLEPEDVAHKEGSPSLSPKEEEQEEAEEKEKEEEVKEEEPQVPRKRGRPKKSAVPPSSTNDKTTPKQGKGYKTAPQNVIESPTVKTRRQRGVPPSAKAPKLADEQADAQHSKSKKKGKGKGKGYKKKGTSKKTPGGSNAIAAALSAQQAAQEGFLTMLRDKYGVQNPEEVATQLPLDKNYAPSAVLLRDMVCALVRAAHNGLPPAMVEASIATPPTAEQPRSGKLVNAENEFPTWPERAANTVWAAASSSPEDRHIALRLAYGDYLDLSPDERLQLLVALVHAALGSDQMLGLISAKIDQVTATTTRRDGGAGDEQEDEDGRLAAAATMAVVVVPPPPPPVSAPVAPAAVSLIQTAAADGSITTTLPPAAVPAPAPLPPPPPPPTALELWRRWHQAQNLGLRRRLGSDARGRRYWALGRQAGAFSIFCEEPENGGWGWYENEGVVQLVTWLSKASIRCEGPLVAALRAAPMALSPPTLTLPARYYVGQDLVLQRADGYRGISHPLLRGEWSYRKEGGPPLTAEQRVPAAIETLLGAIPFWFKDGSVMRQIFSVVDVLSFAAYPRDAARGLLEAEHLLSLDGRMSEEWADLWQTSWRHLVAGLVDMREVALYTAALQEHVQVTPDLFPRPAVLKIADDVSCALTIPEKGDGVVILRTGLLRHLDRYMQLLGITPMDALVNRPGRPLPGGRDATAADNAENETTEASEPAQARSKGEDDQEDDDEQGTTDRMTGVTGNGSVKNEEASSGAAADATAPGGTSSEVPYLATPRVASHAAERIKHDWEALRSRAESLRPVERYIVRGIVYRRHLADIADLEDDEANNAAPRCPVAWLCLRPARFGPSHQLPTEDIVLPIGLDPTLPNYLIQEEEFVQRTRVSWQAGDRFRMFLGGRKRSKSGGTWYRGRVAAVTPPVPAPWAPAEEREAYDPWESVVVEWDTGGEGETENLSPWAIEIDPDEEKRRLDDARKQQQAAARAQRVRASGRRAADDPEAAQQAADWAQEDALLVELTALAERASLLLQINATKAMAEDGVVANEAVYGHAAQQAYQAHLAMVGVPLMAHIAASAAIAMQNAAPAVQPARAAATGGPSSGSAVAALVAASGAAQGGNGTPSGGLASSVPTGPLKPGQEVKQEILDALKALHPDQFVTMLTNFYRGLKGKYKIPIFAHKELDLNVVWWAVMNRGGYETVTGSKSWREICRELPLDLSGQTSASYNMRLNYERCLLDFENYLASGQYEADLAAGRAPQHTHLTDPTITRFSIPGAYPSQPAAPGALVDAVAAEAAKQQGSQPGDQLPQAGGGCENVEINGDDGDGGGEGEKNDADDNENGEGIVGMEGVEEGNTAGEGALDDGAVMDTL